MHNLFSLLSAERCGISVCYLVSVTVCYHGVTDCNDRL